MVWAKREGMSPPPDFWADFLANVDVLFPGASLDQQVLNELYGLVVAEWQNGRQVNLIVRQLCSCDGNTIEPSEGAKRRLEKIRGLAKAPEGAVSGEIFGLDELRAAGIQGKLSAKLALVDARLKSPRVKPAMRERYLRERADIVQAIQTARKQAYWVQKQPEDIYEIPQPPQTQSAIQSYKIEVLAGGGWAGNANRYSSEAEAAAAGADLISRWTAAQDYRVVPTTDLPNIGEAQKTPAPKSPRQRKQKKPAMSDRPPKAQRSMSGKPEAVTPAPDPNLGLDDDIADELIAELSRKA